jgi:hypothetical protein
MRHAFVLMLGLALTMPSAVRAHCDRTDGPVAIAAREALETGEPSKVLIWVGPEQEAELKAAYELSKDARGEGGTAAILAERYLVEAAIRLHREAEGLPFDGVKAASTPLPRDIVVADEAIAAGSSEAVLGMLRSDLEAEVRDLFEAVKRAEQQRGASIDKGREWVDAYVRYVGFVHGLHATIEAGPEHGVGHRD